MTVSQLRGEQIELNELTNRGREERLHERPSTPKARGECSDDSQELRAAGRLAAPLLLLQTLRSSFGPTPSAADWRLRTSRVQSVVPHIALHGQGDQGSVSSLPVEHTVRTYYVYVPAGWIWTDLPT